MVALHHSDGVTPAATMRNWMAEEGARLADGGYPVIPIAAAAKFPGQYTPSRGWEAMLGWQRFCDRLPKAFELDIWRRWPGCGVGIAGGVVVGTDIDVLDPDAADRIEALARAELGDTPAARVGRAPKKLLVYRAAKPFQKMARHPVEIIARGGQFVAYGTHPDTQEPYRWPVDDLSELPLSALPIVTEEQCRRFLDAAYAMVPADLRRNKLGPDRSAEFYKAPGGELRGTVEAVEAALPYIANDDLDYDSWIRIGLALKGALGEDGLPLWLAWSAQSRKSGKSGRADTAQRAWRSFKPREIGAGTIYGYATKNGWNPDFDLVLNGAVAEAMRGAPNPGAGLIAKMANGHRVETPEPGPETEAATEPAAEPRAPDLGLPPVTADPLKPGGFLQEVLDAGLACARRKQPALMLGAAIALTAVLASRRYRGPTGLHPNLYIAALAPSTSGKEHPQSFVADLLARAGFGDLLGGRELTSDAALERSAWQQPTKLFVFDELARVLRPMLSDAAESHVQASAATWLMSAYTKADGILTGKEYANPEAMFGGGKKKGDGPELPSRRDIISPCVSVLGATNETGLWDSANERTVRDGFIGRWLFFAAPAKFPPANRDGGRARIGDELIEAARRIRAGAEDHDYGMLPDSAVMAPTVYTCPVTPEAEETLFAIEDAQIEAQNGLGGEAIAAALYGRLAELTHKLALIHAVSRSPERPEIGADGVAWGYAVARQSVELVVARATTAMAAGDFQRRARRVLEIMAETGSATRSVLLRRLDCSAKQLDEVVQTLEQSEKIVRWKPRHNGTVGRPPSGWSLP